MDALRAWIDSWRSSPQVPEDLSGDTARIEIGHDGWLSPHPAVIRMPSQRGRGSILRGRDGIEPLCVVRHGTATPWGTGAAIARSWRATVQPHSAHVTIDVVTEPSRTAEVARWRLAGWQAEAEQLEALPVGAAVLYQHRSLLEQAWHAYGSTGGRRTSGTIEGHGLNVCSLGLEATCVGQVARRLDGRWRGWARGQGVGYGPAVPADQVQTIGIRTWHTYHPAVLDLERQLDAALLVRWPALAGDVTIDPAPDTGGVPVTVPAMAVGHSDVDPSRKADPYPTGASRGRTI